MGMKRGDIITFRKLTIECGRTLEKVFSGKVVLIDPDGTILASNDKDNWYLETRATDIVGKEDNVMKTYNMLFG